MKTLADLVVSLSYPPAFSLCLLGIALLAWMLRRTWIAGGVAGLALAWSALWSIPFASETLRGVLEHRYAIRDASALPPADAIVVLGGGSNYAWLDRPDVDPAKLRSSRLAAGARAWHAGKASKVILSGGGVGNTTEARRMADAIQRLGVPQNALLLEERSHDTRDNARFSTALLEAGHGGRHVLLVTSALHMPRATLLFTQAGAEVTPVPVPEGRPAIGLRERWLPSRRALWRSGRAFKEFAALTAAWIGAPAH
ncbi:MAG: YdcF family protein [Pseudoxanthomonas sp.]